MYSELFQFGPFTVHTFGLCMALGFLFGWYAAVRLCKLTRQDSNRLTTLLSWLMLSAIFGGRVAYVLEHWTTEFAEQPFTVIRVDQGGLMFYGGLIAAAITLSIYARVYRQHLFAVTDLILAVVPLGHAFGRLGCFMHGCCYGKITHAGIGVCFPKNSPAWWEHVSTAPPLISHNSLQSLPVIPTQLIESLVNALLFIVLYTLYPKRYQQRGFITGCYLLSYASMRFIIEYLRGDPRMVIGPFSISQTIGIGIMILGYVCIACALRTSKSAHTF